jgi:hypothetical protein
MRTAGLVAFVIACSLCGHASAQDAPKKKTVADPFVELEQRLEQERAAEVAFETRSKDAKAKREAADRSKAELAVLKTEHDAAKKKVDEAEKAIASSAAGAPRQQAEAQALEARAAEDAAEEAYDTAEVQAKLEQALATDADRLVTQALEQKDEAEAKAVDAAVKVAVANQEAKREPVEPPPVKKSGVDAYLKARCASALCFEGEWIGIEPLVELPIAKSFAIGNSSLAQYVNNHDITLQLAAGIRVWAFRDLISVAAYLSVPLSSSAVRVEGSEFTYPGASIRRPYPGIAIGLLYDIIWVGFDHDELRNGDSSDASAYNPEYPSNGRVSSCTTISIALQPVTAARALFGAIRNESQRKEKD